LTSFARAEFEPIGNGHGERDDVSAVASRVGVVCLDDIPEQERCSPVCLTELKGMIDSRAPLAGEKGETTPQAGKPPRAPTDEGH